MKKAVIARRCSQALFLLLFIYILWSTTYPLKGLLPPGTFFKTDPLIIFMTSISERLVIPGVVMSSIMLLLTLTLGRYFCGWVCPLGTVIDMAGSIRPRPKVLSDGANKILRKVKFYILAAIFAAALVGKQLAWILDPIVIIGRFVSMNLIPSVTLLLNSIFIFLVKDMGLTGAVRDVYHSLKPTLLGVKAYYFAHSGIILAYFLIVALSAILLSRLWCRVLCPLGALYACLARFAPFRRTLEKCTRCGRCKSVCRTGAIKDDLDYVQGECVMCMDCIYDCPQHITRFEWGHFKKKASERIPENINSGISRKEFIIFAASAFFLSGFTGLKKAVKQSGVIRPPAALKEEEFLNTCVRCGNCMKVCITNGLQPVMFSSGLEGIWTPQLLPEIGYCEYRCTLCGNTCPTGAIPTLSLEKKLKVKLGTAEIEQAICIPWAEGKECIVCQEHCPTAEKAIKLMGAGPGTVKKPYVDESLCVGCGICQNKCPVRPNRAIRVLPRRSYRT